MVPGGVAATLFFLILTFLTSSSLNVVLWRFASCPSARRLVAVSSGALVFLFFLHDIGWLWCVASPWWRCDFVRRLVKGRAVGLVAVNFSFASQCVLLQLCCLVLPGSPLFLVLSCYGFAVT